MTDSISIKNHPVNNLSKISLTISRQLSYSCCTLSAMTVLASICYSSYSSSFYFYCRISLTLANLFSFPFNSISTELSNIFVFSIAPCNYPNTWLLSSLVTLNLCWSSRYFPFNSSSLIYLSSIYYLIFSLSLHAYLI